ncbi:hydantoinase/oxoprolinase family protein [Rhizobium lusitanum]|uniref:hydantoinase/oxoprolinase family protein n=1 Tax=Rhizobium lusitanum TaxID=293958 RepID=UPI00157498CC|nr:hydantoinase/oxoprolinase family protein [Rhizobium lusitanum]NTJ11669.1 hydantoinase/oxoprolinase family protein [Rhizobium lusitanum]
MVYRIGCDVGGTFTDLCLFEEETGKAYFVKTPTTTGHQATAVVEATRTALQLAGLAPADLSGFAHGTTVATNAILERSGARTALLITRGFRDVLAIGRQTRAHLYDQYARKPEPLVPRHFIYEIAERLRPDGSVTEVLNEETVRIAVEAMIAAGIQTVAISFLHSYANPAHEKRAADIVREIAPHLKISISSDVLAEPGEFERTSTTVMNAYLMPPLKDYLERIANTLAADGVTVEPAIMQSGGGVMPIDTASGIKAVHTCLSGPAAGMIGARRFAEAAGYGNVVTIDMGGTSFDVGLIENGQILTRYESEIEGFPLRVPMFDIITLGAGGGSIAHVDAGGLLKIGPESAGARPGPAAYGKGGERATVTDANVILGRLRPGRQIGGGIVIDREKAASAIRTHVANPLGISVEEAAVGILQVVNAAMVRGMRRITVERGLEPRDFAVMAFGGAGPLHAVDLCAELDVETVIVPPSPGLLCGIGLLLAPWKHDETSMISGLAEKMSNSDIRSAIELLVCRVTDQAKKDVIDFKFVTLAPVLEMRYRGQGHQLPISWTAEGLEAAVEAFHQTHHRSFGYDRRGESVEVCLLRLTTSAPPPSDRLPLPMIAAGEDPVIARSALWFEGTMTEVPVYDRAKLALGTMVTGPLIVEQQDTTLIVGAQTLVVDDHGNLIIRMQK